MDKSTWIQQNSDSAHGAYLNIEKGERTGWISTKDMFFSQLQKDADRKPLFYSNVSTLLSMIVGQH